MAAKVLITEDEPNIIESLTFILKRAGYDVAAVSDGEAAMQELHTHRPDVMILDLMVPKLNGFEVLKRVKSDPALSALPVLVLSAKGQAHDRRLVEDMGADAFVTKPFSNRNLIEQIGRLCAPQSHANTPGRSTD